VKITDYGPGHADLLAGGGLTLGSDAGGDLSGLLPFPTVTGIQGIPVSPIPPVDGDVLVYDAGSGEYIPGEPSSSMVPTFIPSGSTFKVPLYKQAMFAMTIDNEGILDVAGFLIEVD
jgi:hypothetical protein